MKVSVIMPAFMAEDFIENSIKSVIDQEYSNYELIIVNDGSSDRTGSIAEKYAKNSEKITLINQINMGASAARNIALDHATGDVISYLDADDLYLPNHLGIRVELIKSGHKFVFGPIWEIKDNYRKKFNGIHEGSDRDCIMPLMVSHLAECTRCERFDPNIVFEEDLDLWRRIEKKYALHQFFDPITAEYHVHARGIHTIYEKGGQSAVYAYRNLHRQEDK